MSDENKNVPGTEINTSEATKSADVAAMEAEIKQLELEAKRLEVKFSAARLVDMEEQLADRELKRETIRQRSRTNGKTLKQTADSDRQSQSRCNHRKGGQGVAGIVGGHGDDNQYAVLKHQFCNGDTWVRCLRCGKTWKPAVRSAYYSEESYLIAVSEYQAALNFNTRNITSGSVVFKFSDGGAFYREQTQPSNLR